MTAQTPLLDVTNLQTHFDTEQGIVRAVDGISFEIAEGEIFGLVGESGSGKSMTALSILQLVDEAGTVTADSLTYQGTELLEKSEEELKSIRGGEISMIFQNPMGSLNPVLTIGEQIAEVVRHHSDTAESTGFWAEMRRKYVTGTSESSPSWQRAVELIERVGIADPETRAKQYPHQLSGGMRQRAMIAQALAGDPSLIIADEPTTALDVSIEAQILDEFRALCDEFDVSVLFITHDLGVVRELCDRVAVMYAGELMEVAQTDELFRSPQHPYTRGLLQSIPKIDDESDWLHPIEGSVPDLANKPSGCPFIDRCDHAFDMCDTPLREYNLSESHSVWCHLHSNESSQQFSEARVPENAAEHHEQEIADPEHGPGGESDDD